MLRPSDPLALGVVAEAKEVDLLAQLGGQKHRVRAATHRHRRVVAVLAGYAAANTTSMLK